MTQKCSKDQLLVYKETLSFLFGKKKKIHTFLRLLPYGKSFWRVNVRFSVSAILLWEWKSFRKGRPIVVLYPFFLFSFVLPLV